jgi:histone H3/H4
MALGRTSDIRPQEGPEDGEATFILPLPGKDPLLDPLSPKEQTVEEYEHSQVNKLHSANIDSPEIDVDEDIEMRSPTLIYTRKLSEKIKGRKRNGIKVSRYGIRYHLLPVGVVKKLTMMVSKDTNNKSRLSKDTLDAIMQASDWFFEQASDDLGAYAEHAGRKTIDESDTITLMKR